MILKLKCFNDVNFAVVQPPNSRFCKIYFESLQANWVWRKLGENREKIVFVISRHKRKVPHWFIIQNYWNWFKNNAFLRFPATRMLVPKFHHFCRNLNWLCLLSHILCHKNINYAKVTFTASNLYCLQEPAENSKTN